MEPISDIFKGKCVCKCCVHKTYSKTGENIRLIIREKTKEKEKENFEKKKLIINI